MDKIKSLIKKEDLLLISIIILLWLLKFWKLDGGFILGEPDERNYAAIVSNFSQSPYPIFDGWFFYHGLPLFHYLAYFFSIIFPIKFLSLRLVSLFASIILALNIYFYLRWKISKWAGFGGALIFTFIPLSVFYSRIGLLEMLVAMFALLFISLFDVAFDRKSKLFAVLAGVSFGFGIATKYTVVPLFVILPMFFLIALKKDKLRINLTSSHVIPVITSISAFLTLLPLFTFNYLYDPVAFRKGLKETFGLASGGLGGRFYVENLDYFLTLTVVILLLVGLVVCLFKIKKTFLFLFPLLIFSYSLIKVSVNQPRYFFIIIPFISVIIGYSLGHLFKRLKSHFMLNLLIVVILILTMVPFSIVAFNSTKHHLIEQVVSYIKEKKQEKHWILSNYWPSAFVDDLGYQTVWLTVSIEDANSLAGELPLFKTVSEKPVSLIGKTGGFVIIEEKYSKVLSSGVAREGAKSLIELSYKPDQIIEDNSPNFPFSKDEKNLIKVYEIKEQ